MTTYSSCHSIYRIAGTTGADLVTEFDGIDLSGKSVSLTMRYQDGGSITKTAVVDDAPNGLCHFVWDPGDLVEGIHYLEYTIVDGAEVKRYPTEQRLVLIVRAQV